MYRQRSWLLNKYQVEGLSIRQIAELCGVSRQPIHYWLKKFGIVRRDFHQPKSEEHKQKLRESMKAIRTSHPSYCSDEYRKKMSIACKGRRVTEKQRAAIIIANRKRIGDKHPMWKGGNSFEPYSAEFNDALKAKIRERDGYQCQVCYTDTNERAFECHHIDGDKTNNSEWNLIALCGRCHKKLINCGELFVAVFRYKIWVKLNLMYGDVEC